MSGSAGLVGVALMVDVPLQWATLPLLELIHVKSDSWGCRLCLLREAPGSGEPWSAESVHVALAAGVTHLRTVHYLRQIEWDPHG
jgi:hypothetical protein